MSDMTSSALADPSPTLVQTLSVVLPCFPNETHTDLLLHELSRGNKCCSVLSVAMLYEVFAQGVNILFTEVV